MQMLILFFALFFPFNLNHHVYQENPALRHVQAEGTNGEYLIRGELKAGQYYYIVEDGHIQHVTEQRFKSIGKEWSPFKISILLPKAKLPKNGTLILHLYQRDREGVIINSYPVLLERFP